MKNQILISIIMLMFSITVYGQSSKTKTESQRITQKEQTSAQGIAEVICNGAPCCRCGGSGCNPCVSDNAAVNDLFNQMTTDKIDKFNTTQKEKIVREFKRLLPNNSEMQSFEDIRARCCKETGKCCPKSSK